MGRGARSEKRATRRQATRRQQTASVASRWNDAKLEAELRAFTDGRNRDRFPTRREFDRACRGDLRCAVDDHGGVEFWADRLGLTLAPSQTAHRVYQEEQALDHAGKVIAELGWLPGAAKLRRMGYGRLATAVQAAGGARRFSATHELPGRQNAM